MLRMALVGLLLAASLAGCSDKAAAPTPVTAPEVFLDGIVVTEAIVPIANANVTATPGDLTATTDESGAFRFGPLEPGSYAITVRVDGYAQQTVQASAGPEVLKVVMVAVRTDVPYIEVLSYDAYLFCTFDNWVVNFQIIGAPCLGVIDLVTGQQVSQDKWQFRFDVTSPGLKGLLVEMVWDEQPLGKHMGMLLRNVAGAGSGIDAAGEGVDVQYASTRGPSPLQMWVIQGIENPGGEQPFHVDNETTQYQVLILGRADNTQTADVHLMVENRPQVFLTLFYHQLGDPSYTVLDNA